MLNCNDWILFIDCRITETLAKEACASRRLFLSRWLVEQVMRVHSIVVDVWAGAQYPYSHSLHPKHIHTQRQSQLQCQKCPLSHFQLECDPWIDGPTDRWTNRRTIGQTKALIQLRAPNKKIAFWGSKSKHIYSGCIGQYRSMGFFSAAADSK